MELFQSTYPFIVWSALAPLALLFMRIILAIMFVDSGRRHAQDPKGRGESLGLPTKVTWLLGAIEVVGGVLILVGLFTMEAAVVLSGVMVGAIYFKVFIWKTGIYGDANNGWYYDALLLAGLGMLVVLGAGSLSIDALL